ncbi:peptidase inhibitor family I36 protein [Streptomyces sp. ISL-43]|uniref:peptidase inhibitor family I36 protein n=1 Tax=Streptomyces sp. ISL-43 TaxID=2819183 RepID=UPI001BEA43C9|nr:peptidase inhibitor family I36 protein [Streptomyces sp. ISL-43]MBT2452835.1 peptidase inhibitor family I36 protein [Streptomyces sp. ISL-43]
MKTNILRGALFTGALALLGGALTAFPASAAGYEACPDNSLCLYSGPDGTNDEGDSVHAFDLAKNSESESYETWNNKAESLMNNSSYWACMYVETRYGGQVKAIAPKAGTKITKGNLSAVAGNLGGKLASHKLAPSQGHCFTGFERCEDGFLCFFQQPSGRGAMFQTQIDYNAYHPDYWAKKIESVYNRTAKSACFYDKPAAEITAADKPFRVLPGDSTTVAGAHADTFVSHKLRDKADCS